MPRDHTAGWTGLLSVFMCDLSGSSEPWATATRRTILSWRISARMAWTYSVLNKFSTVMAAQALPGRLLAPAVREHGPV